jgi:hypothetical protein
MASLVGIFLIAQIPTVTAGLRCAPEIDPIEYTNNISTNPATIGVVISGVATLMEISMAKASVAVPKHSAINFCFMVNYSTKE